MAGIVFPDLGGTIGPLIQMDRQREAQAFQQERATKQDALHAQERADNLAFRKDESQYRRASLEEQRALRLQNHIASMDEKTRAKVKDFSEFRSRGGMAVLSAPPDQQEQAYGMFLQEAKSRGYDMSLFPQQWGPATANRLKFDVDQAKPFADFFSQPQAMPPVGGGAPAPGGSMPGGGGGYSPSAFMQGRIKRGDDPVTAAAWAGNAHHESSFNPTAFNPKDPNGGSHGLIQWNGPRAQALRQFAASRGGNPADPEVQQDFLQSEIDADPQFKAQLAAAPTVQDKAALISMRFIRPADGQNQANLRAQTATRYAQAGAPQPTMGTMPQSWEARGANAAPMPNAPAGTLPGGPPPAEMPNGPQFAQAGGIIPQGDAVAGQGDVMTPPRAAPDPVFELRSWVHQQFPGAAPYADKQGNPIADAQTGLVRIRLQNGQDAYVRPPPKKEAQVGPAGPFAGNNPDVQAFNHLVSTGKMTVEQAANVLGGKSVTNPADGSVIFVPATQLAGVGAPAAAPGPTAPGTAPSPNAAPGTVQLTPPKKDPALKKLETEIRAVESSIDNFQKIITDAGGGSWRAFVNDPTSAQAQTVLGAYNAMKTALRSEAFVNTGVLQPAEMKMLDDMLLSPSSVRGYLATPEGYAAMLDQIRTFVKNKMDAAGVSYGQAPKAASPAPSSAAPPKVGDTQDGYLFKGGDPSKPESWEKVR
jgi:hypothetical protein